MKTKTKSIYLAQQKLSFLNFIADLPNLIAVIVSVVLTRSLITWMDFIDSLGGIIDSIFVIVLSRKLKRNVKYEYNYGIGRIEAISSLVCDFFVITGLVSVTVFSVIDIVHPERPSDLLIYAVLLKVANIIVDSFFMLKQRALSKSGSRVDVSEYKATFKSLLFDIIALISLLICYIFRDFQPAWYIAPVLCIGLALYFFIDCIVRIKSAIRDLTDKTVSEKEQLIILKALAACNDGYFRFISADSHYIGDSVYIDLNITFRPSTTYAEITGFYNRISAIISQQMNNSVVHIIISEQSTGEITKNEVSDENTKTVIPK